MEVAKKITVPFAVNGDRTEIPTEIQSNGSVSREKGFTDHYELPYDNPNSKDIGRSTFNEIEFSQDSAIAEIQQYGVSIFSNEDGYRYPKGALAYHDGAVYQSLKDDNTSNPDTQDWARLLAGKINDASLTQKGIVQLTNTIDDSEDKAATPKALNSLKKRIDEITTPVDQIFIFESAIPPVGYIARNGQAINPATMPKLYARYGAAMPDDRNRVHRMQGDLTGAVGTTQEDAIRNIIGNAGFDKAVVGNQHGSTGGVSGAFGLSNSTISINDSGGRAGSFSGLLFDASLFVPTAEENRVKSRIIIACNKIQ